MGADTSAPIAVPGGRLGPSLPGEAQDPAHTSPAPFAPSASAGGVAVPATRPTAEGVKGSDFQRKSVAVMVLFGDP